MKNISKIILKNKSLLYFHILMEIITSKTLKNNINICTGCPLNKKEMYYFLYFVATYLKLFLFSQI